MKRPPISDAQMDLLATRLAAAGVGRRDFLRVAAGLAAMGAAGFNARSPVTSTSGTAAAAGSRTIPPATTSTRTCIATECPHSGPA